MGRDFGRNRKTAEKRVIVTYHPFSSVQKKWEAEKIRIYLDSYAAVIMTAKIEF